MQPKAELLPKIKFSLPALPVVAPAPPTKGTLPRIKLFGGNRPVASTSAQPVVPEFASRLIKPLKKDRAAKGDKVKVPKKHRTQASGMSMEDVRACQNCLRKLENHRSSEWFRNPVDPVKSGAIESVAVVSSCR